MNFSLAERRAMIDVQHRGITIERQCELLSIHRSGVYYKPPGESALNLKLMELIDKKFLDHPHMGVISMGAYLSKDEGFNINTKRVRRLMRLMGLMAIYRKKKLTIPVAGHMIYPYLLRNLKIERVGQVWQTDITYIPMKKGFLYMMAVIDVKSRYLLNWSISNTMDASWCTAVLKETIRKYGAPEISNTDQGSQFTSHEFLEVLRENNIAISMDGKGRALDNIYIERFWRTLKYEYVYLNPADDGLALHAGIKKYIKYYNQKRRHQSMNLQTPHANYHQKAA